VRELTDLDKIHEFMRALGSTARHRSKIYFTGGTTAVLFGWRNTTVDIDLRFDPEFDELYRALPLLKEQLGINLELVSPSDFIPLVPGWEDRSQFIRSEGLLDFFHYDPYSQALAKIERGHDQDVKDVDEMRYPAIDPASFRRAVDQVVDQAQ
jgi:hypothetical protein